MTDADYVAFCNFAYGLRQMAERFCAVLADEQARQLHGYIRNEISAAPAGKVEPAFDFLAEILAEDIEARDSGQYELATPGAAPKGGFDDLPI